MALNKILRHGGNLKRLFLILFLIFPSFSYGAGNGSLSDPWDALNEATTEMTSCGTYYIKSGTYTTGQLTLDEDCTSGNQLILSCSDGTVEDLGGCVIKTSSDPAVKITGDYNTVKGFDFDYNGEDITPVLIYDDAVSGTGAQYNRITNCRFEGNGNEAINVGRTAGTGENTANTNNQIDHNLFEDLGAVNGWMIRVRLDGDPDQLLNTHTHIHHNAFINHSSGNNLETIQVGDGDAEAAAVATYTTIEYNLFQNCCSDNEIVSIKTSNNILRYNTVIHTDACLDANQQFLYGQFTLRAGSDSEVYGNFFYSDQISNNISGIRAFGDGHKIYNNYIECVDACITGSIKLESDDGGNQVASNILLANNSMVGSSKRGISFEDGTTDPYNITIINNRIESTTTLNASYAYMDCLGAGCTFTSNLTYCPDADCDDGSSISGVSVNSTNDYEQTVQKTGLPLNWYHPDSGEYDNGTYNANVLIDIQGQVRANPPDIGADELGGIDETVAVGPTWTGSYMIQTQDQGATIRGTSIQ